MLNGRSLMVNLVQLTKMLNGNKENDYRHRLKYTECVVLHVCYIYIGLSSGMFLKKIPAVYSFICRNYMFF